MGEAEFTLIAAVIDKAAHVKKYSDPADPYSIALGFCMERLQVSSLHSVPRAAVGVAMLTLPRVPFSAQAMRPWRTPDRGLRPSAP
ncbi:hypothetical protein [Bradyrhizobium iriomotense]|nr:hypothetical protein [Bradyrhizobium iriomotense]